MVSEHRPSRFTAVSPEYSLQGRSGEFAPQVAGNTLSMGAFALPVRWCRRTQWGMTHPSLRSALAIVLPLSALAFVVHLPWLAVAAAAGAVPALISWLAQQ